MTARSLFSRALPGAIKRMLTMHATVPDASLADARRYSMTGPLYHTEGVSVPRTDAAFLLPFGVGLTALVAVYRPTIAELEWSQQMNPQGVPPFTPETRHLTFMLCKPGVEESVILQSFVGVADMPRLTAVFEGRDDLMTREDVEQATRHYAATSEHLLTSMVVVRREVRDVYEARAVAQALATLCVADWWREGAWTDGGAYDNLFAAMDDEAVVASVDMIATAERNLAAGNIMPFLHKLLYVGVSGYLHDQFDIQIHEGERDLNTNEDVFSVVTPEGKVVTPLGATPPTSVS